MHLRNIGFQLKVFRGHKPAHPTIEINAMYLQCISSMKEDKEIKGIVNVDVHCTS